MLIAEFMLGVAGLTGVLAAADWQGPAALAGVAVSLVLGVLTFARGKKADDALNMSTLVKTNQEGMQNFIDQLQEENERNRTIRRETEEELLRVRGELREMRHENKNLRIEQETAKLLVSELERKLAEVTAKCETHEQTIAELRSQLEGKRNT